MTGNKRRIKSRIKSRITTARVVLDIFTERDIERWAERSEDGQRYSDRVYFDLERQRAEHHDELCDALRSAASIEVDVEAWARVTDYRWSMQPLSPAGSLKGIGGRFNIGRDLDRARGQDFPALYIAANVDTAYCEFFGGPPDAHNGRSLLLQEFALRRKTSFTTFSLRGRLENVFDLTDAKGLREFAKVIAKFKLSVDTTRFARKVGLRSGSLIRSAKELLARSLQAPDVWRAEPQLFGIPAANQILGRLIRDAGFEAILYPSQQGGAWRSFRRIFRMVNRPSKLLVGLRQPLSASLWTRTIFASRDEGGDSCSSPQEITPNSRMAGTKFSLLWPGRVSLNRAKRCSSVSVAH